VVTGFGKVDGRRVALYAQDFTVLGGSFSEVQSHKVCKIMELAQESGIPVLGLLDSGGARIQEACVRWRPMASCLCGMSWLRA